MTALELFATPKRARLSPEERAAAARAKDDERARKAAERDRKARGDDMPCLPEIRAEWCSQLRRHRGLSHDPIVSGREMSALRSLLSRAYRLVQASGDRQPLTEREREFIICMFASMFRRAFELERPHYPADLVHIASNPSRYQGGNAPRATTAAQPLGNFGGRRG